jgi:UDP-glucose 4-epimerase
MRALVTGGAGFIGSHVVDSLKASGVTPKIFDLVASPHHEDGEIETALGDLLDPSALRSAMHGCDFVVHLAAMADVGVVERRPADAERINSQGTLNVLEAARDAGVKRVVYASTIWVYSDVEGDTVNEDTPLSPPAHIYTATKLAGELYCRSYAELYGLEYTILRFGIPYGPRARAAAVVPTFVHKAMSGEPLTLAGGGLQTRRFVYVEDLADGVAKALRPAAANRIYNLVGSEDVTIREVAETVGRVVGDTEIVHTPGRSGDFGGVEVCGARAAAELDWRPSTSFSEGVEEYVVWHRGQNGNGSSNGAVAEPVRSGPLARAAAPFRGARVQAPIALLLGVVAMVVLLYEAFRQTSGAHDVRTVATTSLLGLTLYMALSADTDSERRPLSSLARLGWLATGIGLAILWSGPYDPLRLVHSDLKLLILSTLGAALGVGTGMAGRRLLRERLVERRADSGG